MLPDNMLLEIFDVYRKDHEYANRGVLGKEVWRWHLLVRVCRRWRQIIFESPRRLNLRIFCTINTPVEKNLAIWPAFPIVIEYRYAGRSIKPGEEGNVIAALRHSDRVCSIVLQVRGPRLGKVATVMEVPFPVLTSLHIITSNESRGGNVPVLTGGFLGGSAPCLQEIYFSGVPFPAFPILLSSTKDLVTLHLLNIPPTGYISPEAMVVGLAALPRLKVFVIEFQLATPHPNQIRTAPPVTRTVLPTLTNFRFKGASEYLEDLISQIDSPQLDDICIGYLNQLVDFEVGQLSKFIDRSIGPKLTPPFRQVDVTFCRKYIYIAYGHTNESPWKLGPASVTTFIYCTEVDWQVSHMAQVLSHFSMTNSAVVHLNLKGGNEDFHSRGMDHVEWQPFLRQFSTVKTLHVSQELAEHVALALENITEEMVTEVLPSLDWIHVVSQPASSIKKFIAARLLSGRPVTVVDSEWEFEQILESYAST